MRAPVTGAQAELLAFAGGDVGAVFAWRGDDGQADGIDAGDRQRAEAVCILGQPGGVDKEPQEVGLLEHDSGGL